MTGRHRDTVYAVFADQGRIAIAEALREGALPVTTAGRPAGVSKATVSHHVALMDATGVVTRSWQRGRRGTCLIALTPLGRRLLDGVDIEAFRALGQGHRLAAARRIAALPGAITADLYPLAPLKQETWCHHVCVLETAGLITGRRLSNGRRPLNLTDRGTRLLALTDPTALED